VDTTTLKPFDPFDLMDDESNRLAYFFATLDADGWMKDTRCEGWTRRDLVAHLAAGETYNRACLDDKVQELFQEAAQNGATDMNSFNAWTVKIRRSKTAQSVLNEWIESNAYTRSEMRKRGRDGTVATSVGPYPVELQAFHLASEYATHADDMGVPIPASDRFRRLAWRLAFSKVALVEAEKPVAVESRDRRILVRAGDKEQIMSDEDFVDAVSARFKKIDPELQDALRALA